MAKRCAWQAWAATIALAVGLAVVFWLPIWCGAGFVGGDIYSYFFPQKVVYAEALKAGEIPLWNPYAGFGYPLLAESQTGVFYPFNLVLYRLLDVHTAYHVSHLLHYVLAFVFASAAAQRCGLSLAPAWLTALVYVYGWFPPRSCVEWAIIGGTWLPAALWCAESFFATRLWRFAIGLSFVIAIQLLAGHFQIAWFTLQLLAAYVPARLWWFGAASSGVRNQESKHRWSEVRGQRSEKPEAATPERAEPSTLNPRPATRSCVAFIAFAAMFCGLSLAAVQLLPTYELKQRSQRAAVGKDHELDFGSIPPWYWSQVFRPTHWYSPLTDREQAFRENPPLGHARTNSAEAHLYFGLAPLLLALVCVSVAVWAKVSRRVADRASIFWIVVAAASGVYTSGWLLPLTQHLPGFSFFQGAGRYGLLTTWSVAMLAGVSVDRFLREPTVARWQVWTLMAGAIWSLSAWYFLGDDVAAVMTQFQIGNPLALLPTNARGESPMSSLLQVNALTLFVGAIGAALWWLSVRPREWDIRLVLIGLVGLTTTVELWAVSRLVTFTQMVDSPPLKTLEQSPVRKVLLDIAKSNPMLRLFGPGENLPSTLGVPSAPIYLTFGPAEYADSKFMAPPSPPGSKVRPATREQLEWMHRCGVTHVLCFEPLPTDLAGLNLLWQGDDPFLNRAWGRSGQSLFLYAMESSFGRVHWRSLDQPAAENHKALKGSVSELSRTCWDDPLRSGVVCYTRSDQPGVLVLSDLDYPGWVSELDGQRTPIKRIDGIFCGVSVPAGEHMIAFVYRPWSVYYGAAVSLLTFLTLAAIAHIRFWSPQRLAWLDEEKTP